MGRSLLGGKESLCSGLGQSELMDLLTSALILLRGCLQLLDAHYVSPSSPRDSVF